MTIGGEGARFSQESVEFSLSQWKEFPVLLYGMTAQHIMTEVNLTYMIKLPLNKADIILLGFNLTDNTLKDKRLKSWWTSVAAIRF